MKIIKFLKELYTSDDKEVTGVRNLIRFFLLLIGLFFIVFMIGLVIQLRPAPSQTIKLENYTGKDLLFTIEQLQKNKLVPYISQTYNNDVPKYQILSQRPSPGTPVKKGRTVVITASLGRKISEMPSFIGTEVNIAKNELMLLYSAFDVAPTIIVRRQYSSNVQEGFIINQFPQPGKKLISAGEILFLVSRGIASNEFALPNYIGRSFREVEKEASELGLSVNYISTETTVAKWIGKVFSQHPAAGKKVLRGQKLTLEISLKKAKTDSQILREELRIYSLRIPPKGIDENILQNLIDTEESLLTSNLENEKRLIQSLEGDAKQLQIDKTKAIEENLQLYNKMVRRVKIEVTDQLGKGVRFEDKLLPGKTIDLPYKTLGDGELSVYIDGELFETKPFLTTP